MRRHGVGAPKLQEPYPGRQEAVLPTSSNATDPGLPRARGISDPKLSRATASLAQTFSGFRCGRISIRRSLAFSATRTSSLKPTRVAPCLDSVSGDYD